MPPGIVFDKWRWLKGWLHNAWGCNHQSTDCMVEWRAEWRSNGWVVKGLSQGANGCYVRVPRPPILTNVYGQATVRLMCILSHQTLINLVPAGLKAGFIAGFITVKFSNRLSCIHTSPMEGPSTYNPPFRNRTWQPSSFRRLNRRQTTWAADDDVVNVTPSRSWLASSYSTRILDFQCRLNLSRLSWQLMTDATDRLPFFSLRSIRVGMLICIAFTMCPARYSSGDRQSKLSTFSVSSVNCWLNQSDSQCSTTIAFPFVG